MDKANIINNNIQGLSSFSDDNQLNDMGLQMPLNWTDTAVWVDPTIAIWKTPMSMKICRTIPQRNRSST